MTKSEMAEYIRKHREEFPEYTDAEIKYVLKKWEGKSDD